MITDGLEKIVREHKFFAGLPEDTIKLVSGCCRNVRFEPGQYLFHEGEAADEFYLVRHGRVALEVTAPGRGTIVMETVPEGEIAGLSWLIPPYRRSSSARALELVRAIGIDAKCLRGKCDSDHSFGYQMMLRFVPVLVDRLNAARLQILDVYGTPR